MGQSSERRGNSASAKLIKAAANQQQATPEAITDDTYVKSSPKKSYSALALIPIDMMKVGEHKQELPVSKVAMNIKQKKVHEQKMSKSSKGSTSSSNYDYEQTKLEFQKVESELQKRVGSAAPSPTSPKEPQQQPAIEDSKWEERKKKKLAAIEARLNETNPARSGRSHPYLETTAGAALQLRDASTGRSRRGSSAERALKPYTGEATKPVSNTLHDKERPERKLRLSKEPAEEREFVPTTDEKDFKTFSRSPSPMKKDAAVGEDKMRKSAESYYSDDFEAEDAPGGSPENAVAPTALQAAEQLADKLNASFRSQSEHSVHSIHSVASHSRSFTGSERAHSRGKSRKKNKDIFGTRHNP